MSGVYRVTVTRTQTVVARSREHATDLAYHIDWRELPQSAGSITVHERSPGDAITHTLEETT